MSLLRNFFAGIGFVVVTMGVAGSLGIGYFRLFYGPHAPECPKDEGRGLGMEAMPRGPGRIEPESTTSDPKSTAG